VEKLKAGTIVVEESGKSYTVSGIGNQPSRVVPGMVNHATYVKNMATNADEDFVICEGGLPHVDEPEKVRIIKRTNRPIRKYVRKVNGHSFGPSFSVDLEDPVQFAAFLNSVTTLVHDIAVAANVTGSGTGTLGNSMFPSDLISLDDVVLVTSPPDGVSTNPAATTAEGGTSNSFTPPPTVRKTHRLERTPRTPSKTLQHGSSTSAVSIKRKGKHQARSSTATRKHKKVGHSCPIRRPPSMPLRNLYAFHFVQFCEASNTYIR
jgi:hypothetical protein